MSTKSENVIIKKIEKKNKLRILSENKNKRIGEKRRHTYVTRSWRSINQWATRF